MNLSLPPRDCAQCGQVIQKPTWNQRVHYGCRRAWKKAFHARWWKRKGADLQRKMRAKQRNGARVEIPLVFAKRFTRFEER